MCGQLMCNLQGSSRPRRLPMKHCAHTQGGAIHAALVTGTNATRRTKAGAIRQTGKAAYSLFAYSYFRGDVLIPW